MDRSARRRSERPGPHHHGVSEPVIEEHCGVSAMQEHQVPECGKREDGREIEFFYDRRIIGFDSGDQVQLTDALRDSVGGASRMMDFWRGRSPGALPAPAKAVIVLLGLREAPLREGFEEDPAAAVPESKTPAVVRSST